MNTPGEPYGNWTWRLEPGQLTDALAERLRAAAAATGRL
jgi:4-alpha-glucanotransferase